MSKCAHIKTDGSRCGSPAMRDQILCFFHYRWAQRAARLDRLGGPVGLNQNSGIQFPVLEDRRSIQVAIMEVLHAINDCRIDNKRAALLLYGLQLASSNAQKFEEWGLTKSKSVRDPLNLLSSFDYTSAPEGDIRSDADDAGLKASSTHP